jgi:excinuclease ABC subunit B
MDADKEGFLRSERSLIQTIGRAARHLNGKAILFANKITNSMRRAMDETDRRRNIQIAHNKKHGITPVGINKKISDIMEGAVVVGKGRRGKVSEKEASYLLHPELEGKNLKQKLKILEEKMYQAAKDLDFEKAASLRDQLKQLKIEEG